MKKRRPASWLPARRPLRATNSCSMRNRLWMVISVPLIVTSMNWLCCSGGTCRSNASQAEFCMTFVPIQSTTAPDASPFILAHESDACVTNENPNLDGPEFFRLSWGKLDGLDSCEVEDRIGQADGLNATDQRADTQQNCSTP